MHTNGPVTTLTLSRPEIRNALGPEMILELTQLFGALARDQSRVIVITGEGDAFCAGADIEWMKASRTLSDAQNVADATTARTMWEAIDTCPKPVVARINSQALGGGSYAYTPSSHALSCASRAAASTPSTKRCALSPTTPP